MRFSSRYLWWNNCACHKLWFLVTNSGETLPRCQRPVNALPKKQTPAVIILSRLFSIMSWPSNYLCSHCPTFRRTRLRLAVGSFNGACSRTPSYIKPATRYMKHRHKWDAAPEEWVSAWSRSLNNDAWRGASVCSCGTKFMSKVFMLWSEWAEFKKKKKKGPPIFYPWM